MTEQHDAPHLNTPQMHIFYSPNLKLDHVFIRCWRVNQIFSCLIKLLYVLYFKNTTNWYQTSKSIQHSSRLRSPVRSSRLFLDNHTFRSVDFWMFLFTGHQKRSKLNIRTLVSSRVISRPCRESFWVKMFRLLLVKSESTFSFSLPHFVRGKRSVAPGAARFKQLSSSRSLHKLLGSVALTLASLLNMQPINHVYAQSPKYTVSDTDSEQRSLVNSAQPSCTQSMHILYAWRDTAIFHATIHIWQVSSLLCAKSLNLVNT